MLMDHKNKHWETTNVGRQTGLSHVAKASLKYYVHYMASINHPLSIAAVKTFAWAIAEQK